MHKLAIAAGGLRGFIPQGLAVPSQVQDMHGGSTSVDTSHHIAFCSDADQTVAGYMNAESSACHPSHAAIYPASWPLSQGYAELCQVTPMSVQILSSRT